MALAPALAAGEADPALEPDVAFAGGADAAFVDDALDAAVFLGAALVDLVAAVRLVAGLLAAATALEGFDAALRVVAAPLVLLAVPFVLVAALPLFLAAPVLPLAADLAAERVGRDGWTAAGYLGLI